MIGHVHAHVHAHMHVHVHVQVMHGPIKGLAQHRNDHVEQQHHRKEDEAVGEHKPNNLKGYS
eukprot:scaffold26112_cov61-Phaeocystis_antarctica.AAC.1